MFSWIKALSPIHLSLTDGQISYCDPRLPDKTKHQVTLQILQIPWLFMQGKLKMGLKAYIFVLKRQKFLDTSLLHPQSPAFLLPPASSLPLRREIHGVCTEWAGASRTWLRACCVGAVLVADAAIPPYWVRRAQDSLVQWHEGAWQGLPCTYPCPYPPRLSWLTYHCCCLHAVLVALLPHLVSGLVSPVWRECAGSAVLLWRWKAQGRKWPGRTESKTICPLSEGCS